MNGNNTNDEILNNQILNTTQNSIKEETSDSQQQISVNNNELVIYQDVDGEYKTFMLSPQQMAELEILVQTSPAFQTETSQCSVINTFENLPPKIVDSGVQLMASSFEPISLSNVNNFSSNNDDTVSDPTSPQYIFNKPKNLQALLYRNTNPTISISEPYFSNPLIIPGTVLLNNEQNFNNIMQLENAMNIVTDNAEHSTDGENTPKEVVSSSPLNNTKEISGMKQAGQDIKKELDSKIVNNVIGNLNVPITLQANGSLLPVRIANGNITKIRKSAANHTTVHLLKTGDLFHSMEHLDSEKLKAVATAVNSVGNVTINKNYSMFDPATKTRIIYRLVYPEDLNMINNMKAKKHGRRPKSQTENSATAPTTVPEQVKVTRSGRTVRQPRHIDGTLHAYIATSPLPKKRLAIFTCPYCSKRFQGQKRLEQHFEIHPQHRPPEVIKPKPVNQRPLTPKLVNLQPANLKPANLKPADKQPANLHPANSQPASSQLANSQPANSQPANTHPTNPQPVNPQPANPQPVNPQPANPQPVNPQPASPQPPNAQLAIPLLTNSQPTKPQPANPPPPNPQPEPESQPADKNLNLFECLLNILDKTTKENRAMVFVQQLETLLVRLRSLMPCLIGARVRRHGSLCSINKELGRVFDVTAGNYTLDMDALKCTKDIDGICHHLSAEIIVDDISDDCIDTDTPEVPCSRTHSVEDWPLANKRVWNTTVKTNSTRNGQNGGSLSGVKSKVRSDCYSYSSDANSKMLNLMEKERLSCPTIKEEVNTDSKMSITNKNKVIADHDKSINSTVVGFREMGDNLIGMFTYDSHNTVPLTKVQSPDPIDPGEVPEQNIDSTYKFHSSHFNKRSSPLKIISEGVNKIQMKRECLPTFVKLAEQERSFSLPDVITDPSEKCTDSVLQSIPIYTQAINDFKSHNLDRNTDMKVVKSAIVDFPMSGESSDLDVTPTQSSRNLNSAQKFTLDDHQNNLANKELNRTSAYLTNIHLADSLKSSNETMISHNFTDEKSTSLENHLASADLYISKLEPTERKAKTNKNFEKGKRRKKIKKCILDNNLDITDSLFCHTDASHITNNTRKKSDSFPEKYVDKKLNMTNSFLSNMLSPNVISHKIPSVKSTLMENHIASTDSYISKLQLTETKTKTNKTTEKGKRRKKITKSMADNNLDIPDSFFSNSNSVVSHMTKNTRTKSDSFPEKFVGNQLTTTDSFLSNMLSPNLHVITKENAITDRKKQLANKDLNATDLFLSNIHSSTEQISSNVMLSQTLSSEKSHSLDTKLGKTDPIMSSIHHASTPSRNSQLDATDSYITNIHSPDMCTHENMISSNLMEEHRQRNLLDDEIDRADSYLTKIHSSHEQIDLANGKNRIKNNLNETDSIFSSVHSNDVQMSAELANAVLNGTDTYLSSMQAPIVQMSTNESVISESLSNGQRQRLLVSNETDSFLSNMNSSNEHMCRNETATSDCTNEIMQRNLDENECDRTDSYLLNVRSKHTKSSNGSMVTSDLTNRELHMSDSKTKSIYSHVDSSDDCGSHLEVNELDRNESFLSNLHSSNAQMSSDVNIISECSANGKNQRSLVDTDVDRAEAFLANMHSSDAQMSSNETDSMSEVKMNQHEGLLSVNESSLDSGRLSSLQLLDLSLSFTDAASSQMSLDLPLDLFPYHHP